MIQDTRDAVIRQDQMNAYWSAAQAEATFQIGGGARVQRYGNARVSCHQCIGLSQFGMVKRPKHA